METEKILRKMTLEQKVGQLWQVLGSDIYQDSQAEVTGTTHDISEDYSRAGSVLNFADREEKRKIEEIYSQGSQDKIPLLFMRDIIHGCRTSYPSPLGMGCTFNPELMEECAAMAAREAKSCGIDVTFSPMVDLVRDPRWGRVVESTGEDPYYNGVMAAAQIRGYQREGVSACVKHFAAYGAPEGGRDYNTVDMSEYRLRNIYLRPYEMAVKAKPDMVMSSFNSLNGVPMNAHTHVLKDILREEWGFDGVLISDYNAIPEMMTHGICATKEECAEVAICNEVDIEMVSDCYEESLPSLVEKGRVEESQIDKSVRRILALKEKHGLFRDSRPEVPDIQTLLQDDEHRKSAREACLESMVLLKNDGVLPLSRNSRVAFIGPFLYERNLVGSWCGDCNRQHKSILDALSEFLGFSPLHGRGVNLDYFREDISGLEAALDTVREADIVVAFLGEDVGYTGEASSRTNIELTNAQKLLMKKVAETGKKLVLVLISGRPLIITEEEPLADAILYANNPGEFGPDAIVETLYGINNPSGKLDMSFPYSLGQVPLWYSDYSTGRPRMNDSMPPRAYVSGYLDAPNGPLYSFGFGLSYTTFEISKVSLSAAEMEETVVVTAYVKNTGARDGKEVIQLYMKQDHPSAIRPNKELIHFRKVFLKAGCEAKVEFLVTRNDLGFYNLNNRFVTEAGTYRLYVGNSPRQGTELSLQVKETRN